MRIVQVGETDFAERKYCFPYLTKGKSNDIMNRTQFLGIFLYAKIRVCIYTSKLHTIGCPVIMFQSAQPVVYKHLLPKKRRTNQCLRLTSL